MTPTGLATIRTGASEDFRRLVPRDFARRHLLVSLGVADDGTERLRVAATTDGCAIHNVGVRLGRYVTTEVGDAEEIAQRIDHEFGTSDTSAGDNHDLALDDNETELDIDRLAAIADRDLLSTEGRSPIAQLVNALLFHASTHGASDLHIQCLEQTALVRLRVDGVLRVIRELPASVTPAVISRIKVMGGMDIAERRVPQDGRATVTIGETRSGGRSIDLRISTIPTSHGERMVIRLLDTERGTAMRDFSTLGMPADVERPYRESASRANGIILLTGPTGSGKTTTLYTTLRWIAQRDSGELNVLTIEDPIEYELSTPEIAISQMQVNEKKGVTFATGLRHIVRQDPDVIMVGEIRDLETARIAVQASLTGHLVFSTLHTNDAAGTVTRLLDLGIEPYLVSASLSAVLAQRLIRRVHADCAGDGCATCLETGLRGRTALFELLTVSESIRELVASNASTAEVAALARQEGMRTLREDGERLVNAGVTTRHEILRATTTVASTKRVAPGSD